jgi:hypothetical protein
MGGSRDSNLDAHAQSRVAALAPRRYFGVMSIGTEPLENAWQFDYLLAENARPQRNEAQTYEQV